MATDETPSPDAPAEAKSFFERFGAALPVALTALGTALAGLSTSEMTQAMFWRGAAAQDQAKATNQWALAGFKRDRSLIVQAAAANLRATAGYAAVPVSAADANPQAVDWLAGNGPPRVEFPTPGDETLVELAKSIRARRPEAELQQLAARVPVGRINEAIDAGEAFVEKTTEQEWDPVAKAAAAIVAKSAGPGAQSDRATALQAAGFELEGRRYLAEARLNQQVGFLYEARVRVLTAESDRHKERSKNFFYAMLAAQIGATVASLAMARRERSSLWLVAGLAGLTAIGFGVYVYLGM